MVVVVVVVCSAEHRAGLLCVSLSVLGPARNRGHGLRKLLQLLRPLDHVGYGAFHHFQPRFHPLHGGLEGAVKLCRNVRVGCKRKKGSVICGVVFVCVWLVVVVVAMVQGRRGGGGRVSRQVVVCLFSSFFVSVARVRVCRAAPGKGTQRAARPGGAGSDCVHGP